MKFEIKPVFGGFEALFKNFIETININDVHLNVKHILAYILSIYYNKVVHIYIYKLFLKKLKS